MSVEENILLMRRWFQEVWNEERTKTIYDLLAENAIGVGQDQPGALLFLRRRQSQRSRSLSRIDI
jgi:hypothetical protein